MTELSKEQLGELAEVLEADFKSEYYLEWERSYGDNYPHSRHKIFEHFASAELCFIGEGDMVLDVAADQSPFIDKLGGLGYKQDIAYEAGIHGNKIGSPASSIPLPDGSVDVITLHCSFEHFEGDEDAGFIRECARLLKPLGICCILPFYTWQQYLLTPPQPSPNTGFGRFYDLEHIRSRIFTNIDDLIPYFVRVSLDGEYKFTAFMLKRDELDRF